MTLIGMAAGVCAVTLLSTFVRNRLAPRPASLGTDP